MVLRTSIPAPLLSIPIEHAFFFLCYYCSCSWESLFTEVKNRARMYGAQRRLRVRAYTTLLPAYAINASATLSEIYLTVVLQLVQIFLTLFALNVYTVHFNFSKRICTTICKAELYVCDCRCYEKKTDPSSIFTAGIVFMIRTLFDAIQLRSFVVSNASDF